MSNPREKRTFVGDHRKKTFCRREIKPFHHNQKQSRGKKGAADGKKRRIVAGKRGVGASRKAAHRYTFVNFSPGEEKTSHRRKILGAQGGLQNCEGYKTKGSPTDNQENGGANGGHRTM